MIDFRKAELKNGDRIKIGRATYEVLYVQEEADYGGHPHSPMRKLLAVYLHDNRAKSLQPTHLLKYYYDTGEFFLGGLQFRKVAGKDGPELVRQ